MNEKRQKKNISEVKSCHFFRLLYVQNDSLNKGFNFLQVNEWG